MDKAERLKLIRQKVQQQAEKELLLFTGLPVSRDEIQEDIAATDAFRETVRDRASERQGLTSDEL